MEFRIQSSYFRHAVKILLFSGLFLVLYLTSLIPVLSASEVPVYPWQDLQSMVTSYPAGTTFLIKAGVHRMQYAIPKNYDTFIGESGAILDGAKQLTSISQSGSYWVAHVNVVYKTPRPGVCDSSHPACDHPEDLFIDSIPRTRVSSLSQVGPGKWYLDYNTGDVYMGDNPSGHNVEISLTPYAFTGSATGVKISQLLIEKYATPGDDGTVGGPASSMHGPHWAVEWNDIRLNHGMGVRVGDNTWVYHNLLHDNGQLGIGGSGKNDVIQSNQVYSNNYAGYSYGWEAGGAKFASCYNLKIQYNNFHNNRGPGLWTDINTDSVLIEHNQTSNNLMAGIFIEISYNEIVRYNYVTYDGFSSLGTSIWWGAGILVNSSPGIQIYGNVVKYCMNAIGGVQGNRGTGPYGPHLIQNLSVQDNTITQVNGTAEGIVKASNFDDSIYTSWNNHLQNDTFTLTYPTMNYFYWLDGYHTLPWWINYSLIH